MEECYTAVPSFAEYPMKTAAALLLATSIATSVVADEKRFSAADVPAAKLRKAGRVVIQNDSSRITAWRFAGNIREALVTLRATRRLSTNPFGAAIYDSRAAVRVPSHLEAAVREAANAHGVDPRLIAAVAMRESAWNARAVSAVGARGVMQLMPATAEYLGVRDSFDARQNILGGTRYLRTLLDSFDGDIDLALAAYNAGPGAVAKYKGIPPYRETRQYVAAVRAAYERQLNAPTLR